MGLRSAVKGFQDYADSIPVRLTLEDFSREIATYLARNLSLIRLSPEIELALLKKTRNFLRTLGAVQNLKDVVNGKDQKERARLIRAVTKKIDDLQKQLNASKGHGLPMTEMLAEALHNHFEGVREDLRWMRLKQNNNRDLVAGCLRPELTSQFILQLNDFLARRLPEFQQQQRDEVILGVLLCAQVFSPEQARRGLLEVLRMRRWRTIRSEKKARRQEEPVE